MILPSVAGPSINRLPITTRAISPTPHFLDTLAKDMVRTFAPGKCILFGEHAVVYGHPAVAVAIDAGVEVELTESDSWTIEGMPFQSERTTSFHILNDVFDYGGSPLKIEIESGLFFSRWIGIFCSPIECYGGSCTSNQRVPIQGGFNKIG